MRKVPGARVGSDFKEFGVCVSSSVWICFVPTNFQKRIHVDQRSRPPPFHRMSLQSQRLLAYQQHVLHVRNISTRTEFTPYEYKDFQWNTCAVCQTEIRDTAFGHNPAPLADTGVCCNTCYLKACFTRLRENHGFKKATELVEWISTTLI